MATGLLIIATGKKQKDISSFSGFGKHIVELLLWVKHHLLLIWKPALLIKPFDNI
jgi:hypothetical protein